MKVIVFNNAIPLDPQPGEEWENRTLGISPFSSPGLLATDNMAGIPDTDLFVCATDTIQKLDTGPRHSQNRYAHVRPTIVSCVEAGAILVCFVVDTNVHWFSGKIKATAVSGEYVTILPDEPLAPLFEAAGAANYNFRVQLDVGDTPLWQWRRIASSKDDKSVALAAKIGKGWVFFLPFFRDRSKVVRVLIDRILPGHGFSISTNKPSEEEPAWVREFVPEKLTGLDIEIQCRSDDIGRLELERERLGSERLEIYRYTRLLWAEGFELQELVREALNTLGVPAYNEEPVDLVVDLEATKKLYIEVHGTTSGIKLQKGSQLLTTITRDDPDGREISGCLVVNPFRKEHPSNRQSIGQKPAIGPQLKKFAKSQKYPIVTTVELYELLKAYLDNDPSAQFRTRKLLGIP